MQAFSCNGFWWLPENPEGKVAGALHFSDDEGASLVLTGVLGEPAASLREKTVPIILGLVWDCPSGSLVTLKGCRVKGFHLGSIGIAREDYFADRLFIGAHLKREADFSFSDIGISLSGLPSWAEILSGLKDQQIPGGEGHSAGFGIHWLPPEPITGPIPDGQFTLGVGAKFSRPRRGWSVTEEFGFNVSCSEPRSVEELIERYVYPLQNFLTLATDHPNALVEFTVRRPDRRDRIHVLAAWTFHDVEAASNLFPYKMLFTLEDVKSQAAGLIHKWFQVSDRLRDVCNLFFGIQYKPDSFVDTRFLIVFQALEVYQRRRNPAASQGTGLSGLSLDELFAKLVEEHKETVGPLFGDDVAAFVPDVMKYRNFVVHRDTNLGASPTYGRDLFWLTQKLMFLMKACLLTELGIPALDQSRFFQRNQMYLHVLNLSKS